MTLNVQCDCGTAIGCFKCNPMFHSTPIVNPINPYIPQTVSFTAKGWECPRCSRIYSPSCTECFHCNGLINGYIVSGSTK